MAYMELGLYTEEFPHFLHDVGGEVVPRSELTLKGSPNLEKMWFINRQAVVSAVSLGAGRHSIHFVNSQTTVRKYLLPRVDRGRGPTQSIWRSDQGKSFLSLQWSSVVWVCRLKLATHQASFYVFRHVLLHARPVCYLLECFIGGLGAVVSCAWCIVGVCQHHPPLAVRDYELWRS